MAGGMVVTLPEKRPQTGFRVSLRLVGEDGGWTGGPVTTAGLMEVIAKGGLWQLVPQYGFECGEQVQTLCSSPKSHMARSAAALEAGYRTVGGVSEPSFLCSASAHVFQSAAVKV